MAESDATDQDETPSAAELESAGQSAMFGGTPATEAAPAAGPAAQPYRVLARKYRPQTFAELIGQDAMVHTLGNAIARDRLAHAFLMTGVRGVGKTSTARLIAKALNCIGPDGEGGPTIDPCGQCEPCVAIAEGRHIDVLEMDAASNTGVDNIREIIEAVRYAAVSARYKIYIVDEVHMLSRGAFNALLKTLEEPPPHVKFLFATTEVEKLPVTVLSRTQRFDLRRIESGALVEHFASICTQEDVEAERDALAMIAGAAEGSVRDGLSILDQAIAHADLDSDAGAPVVSAAKVREMLGLADRGARLRLFEAMLAGEAAPLIAGIAEQHALGVEPLALVRSQMELVHLVTLSQIGEGGLDGLGEEDRDAIAALAGKLGAGQLHRLWQLLLKGYEEVRLAPEPLAAAQMALLRVLHAADQPDPGELARKLAELEKRPPASPEQANGSAAPAPAATAIEAPAPDWEELIERVDQAGRLRTAQTMRDWVRVIELRAGQLVFSVADRLADDPSAELRDALLVATDRRWVVERQTEGGAPSLREQAEAAVEKQRAALRAHPLVEAAFAAFPDAEMIDDGQSDSNEHEQWRATS